MKIKIGCLISALFLLISCNKKSIEIGSKKVDILPYQGKWESVSPENLGNGTYGKRVFTFKDNTWEVQFILFLDSALSQSVFKFRGGGTFEEEGNSRVLTNTKNALFKFEYKYLTLLNSNEEIINGFGFAACNLDFNIEKEITDEGCSFFESITACAQEYDLLKLENNLLYLGARPKEGNMCVPDRRPVELNYPLRKT